MNIFSYHAARTSVIVAMLSLPLMLVGAVQLRADPGDNTEIKLVHGEHVREFKYPTKHDHEHCHLYVDHGYVHKKCHAHEHYKSGDHH
jgi:hypothetical protein